MKRLVIEKEGVLYCNPRPGYKAECAFLANVVPLSETELICFYRCGQAFYSADGVLAKLRSTDGGLTWKQDGLVWEPARDDQPYNYTAPHGAKLRDGSLVLIAYRNDAHNPDRLVANPKTGGMIRAEHLLFRSDDGGQTWSPPEVMELQQQATTDTPSQITELESGRWFLACEQWKDWDDPRPLHIQGYALFSDDRGRSWGERLDFPSADNRERMFSHSRYTRMLDGRVCALQWTQQIGGQQDFDLHFTVSDETATRWSEPQPTGIAGQTSWVADLGDGRLAAAYTRREDMKPGILALLSHDEGKTWDRKSEVMLWDAVGQEYLGCERVPDYPASHDNIAFGKPNLARMPGGSLLASWWCTQACITHIRFARLRIE
ncbi:MAG: sialidase family protein [Planctomycetota bacterium]|nr:sialidase family protein [Planctomycetota bacterium]